MQDSNQFHAVCLDTYPPIFYMNDISKAIIRICTVINAHFGSIKAAYTFDAGPNAVIYTLEKDVPLVMTVMAKYFPAPGAADLYCNKPAGDPLLWHPLYLSSLIKLVDHIFPLILPSRSTLYHRLSAGRQRRHLPGPRAGRATGQTQGRRPSARRRGRQIHF